MRPKIQKAFKILIATLSLGGILGSIYMEVHQSIPCPLCLTIRYSLVSILIISILSMIWEKVFFLLVIPIIVALSADFRIISQEFFSKSYLCEGNPCQTPEFLGIRLSVWAALILMSISSIFIAELISSLRTKVK